MKLFYINRVVLVIVLLISLQIYAQMEKAEDQLFIVHEDVVIPTMVQQYEEASIAFTDMLKKHQLEIPYMRASMTDDFHYYYLIPIQDYGDMDKMDETWGNFIKKVGKDTWASVMSKFDGTLQYHKDFVIKKSHELSYDPEKPRLAMEEIKFLHWDFYHVMEDKGKEAKDIAKMFAELNKKHSNPNAYSIYTGDIGMEIPVIIVVSYGKDLVDFSTEMMKNQEKMGTEFKQLQQKAMAITKKFEHKNGITRRDLSYIPEKSLSTK